MIQMGMGHKHGIQRGNIERQRLPVALSQPLVPLKQAAIDQYTCLAGFNQELGAGHGFRATQKCNVHRRSPST